MIARPPELPRANPLADLARGFLLPLRALSLLFATPRLFRLTVAVAGLTVVSLGLLVWGLLQITPGLVEMIWKQPEPWYLVWLHWALTAFVFLLLFVLGANTLPLTLASPLMDAISEGAEQAMGGEVAGGGGVLGLVKDLLLAIANTLARIALLYLGHALLLLLLLIPGVGAAIWTWVGWGWTVIWLAAEYLDVVMARHRYRFRYVRSVLVDRPFLCFGFGAAIYFLLWIPLLNFFFVPVAVIGATMLFRGILGTGALPPPEALHSSRLQVG